MEAIVHMLQVQLNCISPQRYLCLITGFVLLLASKHLNLLWEILLIVVEYLGPAFKLHRSLGQFEILALWAGFHPASEYCSGV